MSWDSTLVKMAGYTVRGTLRTVGGRVPKDRYKALLSGLVAGMLSEHPDLSQAQAVRRAEAATGNKPAPELIDKPAGHTASRPTAKSSGSTTRSASNGAKGSTAKKKKKTGARTSRPAARRSTTRSTTRKPAVRKRTARKVTRR